MGCHVIYGLFLKTHCKLALVIRRDEDGIRRYMHLGTGNYNDVTAHFYTDMGLFMRDYELGEDMTNLFNMLQDLLGHATSISCESHQMAFGSLLMARLMSRSRLLRPAAQL